MGCPQFQGGATSSLTLGGADKDSAEVLHVGALIAALDALAQSGAAACYVELLAKPGHRQHRPAGAVAEAGASGTDAA